MPLAFGDVGGYPGLGGNLPQYVQGANPFMYRDAALQHIYGAMQGPYTPEWQNRESSRQADRLAFSEGQAQEQVRNDAANRGMAPTDPSVQAQQRSLSDQRRRATIGVAGDVRRQSTMANYQGGMDAAKTLMNYQMPFSNYSSPGASVKGYQGADMSYRKR
jgi:hypothetical protein